MITRLETIKIWLRKKSKSRKPKPSAEAYNLWSGSYDMQSGNLMLDLDEEIFSALLKDVSLENKTIADIGCGTGRHWKKLYANAPASVQGYDVSKGMLRQLKFKFPAAVVQHITDNRLPDIKTASLDCIISTLTIAHIENLEEAVTTWARILKPGGDVILTDFHPDALANGGQRTFRHADKQLSVVNFVHPLDIIKNVCEKNGLVVCRQEERFVNEQVRSYYENQHALQVYDQFKGMAIIFGLHLKKQYVAD